MKNLAHSASFDSEDKDAPSNLGSNIYCRCPVKTGAVRLTQSHFFDLPVFVEKASAANGISSGVSQY
jgi:hypothetical protein